MFRKAVMRTFLVCWLLVPFLAIAQSDNSSSESLLRDVDVKIKVGENSNIYVEERFLLDVRRNSTAKNFFRDLDSFRRDDANNLFKIDYQIQEVLVDGKACSYSFNEYTNFKRLLVNIDKDRIKPGEYDIVIKYVAKNAINFSEELDRFNWISNFEGWDIQIGHARVVVELPKGVGVISYQISPSDHNISNYKVDYDTIGNIVLNTKYSLDRREAFDFGLEWRHGIIKQAFDSKPFMTYREGLIRFWGFLFLWLSFLVAICFAGRRVNR